MKKLANLGLAAILATGLSGCVIVADGRDNDKSSWETSQKENRALISELAIKSSRAYVINKMGTPNFTEAFVKGNDEYRVLYYRTQHRHSDGDTTKDETTPLVFKNDLLIGWGHKVLAELH
jgi:outer membrane protein assembly factor BamE (lipoprotein component of BamABCDE complex)